MGTAQNFGPPVPTQYLPAVSGQQFLAGSSQQHPPAGQGLSSGPNQPMHFSQPMPQQLPSRTGMHGAPMTSQAMPMPYGPPNRPMTLGAQQNHHSAPPFAHHPSGGALFSSSYAFQQVSHMSTPTTPADGQQWLQFGSQSSAPVPQLADAAPALNHPDANQLSSSDWQEHKTPDGRRYFYNKKTKQSSWEKPLELMTPTERADASTVWKEFTTPEGKKYYYNKITKESKWTIPEELKLAREQAEKAASQGGQLDTGIQSQSSGVLTSDEVLIAAAVVASSNVASPTLLGLPLAVNPSPAINVPSSEPSVGHSPSPTNVVASAPAVITPVVASASGDAGLRAVLKSSSATMIVSDKLPYHEISTSTDGASVQDIKDVLKGLAAAGKVELSEKPTNDEPLVFPNKQEAKNAFKSLLESANVQSDWTWDQAMRVIVNDKRYGALKTLGERKQAFNEFLGQRRKVEAEERRLRQKKAKEEFTKMLEESEELKSSIKWSKAITVFEDDERFKAVEKPKDRQELFENYLVELQKKEKEKAEEEYRQNREEYWKFLESCDFIEANSLWRKVQDRLEDDERCLRLEKIDRLEVFQDYIRYLEKDEEEQKKLEKEQARRAERKNRDEFRKILEADVAAGVLTAKTCWREYRAKVKECSAYVAVARNMSGSTPKDLFEDVVEDLENQYHDDRGRVKDAIKLCKITLTSTWTFAELKASISSELGSSAVSDINLKLIFEEQLERIKEKEEKEAKKRQRLLDDFTELLRSFKEITASSSWEDCRQLFEDSEEYREFEDQTVAKETFDDYVAYLRQKERKREEEKVKKEKEREEKEKRKEKERKEKDKEKRKDRSKKEESEDEAVETTDSHSHRDENRKEREKDRDRKHRKRHHDNVEDVGSDKDDDREKRHRKRQYDTADDVSSDREDKENKKSRRHGSDRKKSRKHESSPDSDGESRHKKHKKDPSRRNGTHDDLEDGELGEDGEIPVMHVLM